MLRRTRARYWSHGWLAKLTAKWLGAPPRPKWGTMEEWNAFNKNQKKNFALQENIEDFLGWLQRIVSFPGDVIHTIRCHIRNRFNTKTHVLETGLDPGKWYEYDYRMLHGLFNSFVQFIEDEQTMDNLKWELTLTEKFEWLPEEEAKQQPGYDQPCRQALAAQEKMALYTWWTVTRPARPDAYDASGFAKFSQENKKDDDDVFSLFVDDGDTVKTETRHTLSTKWREIDAQYDQEDEDMMIRLIRLRHSLWT